MARSKANALKAERKQAKGKGRKKAPVSPAARICTFDEFCEREARTEADKAMYWSLLGSLQRMGWVDDRLNVVKQ